LAERRGDERDNNRLSDPKTLVRRLREGRLSYAGFAAAFTDLLNNDLERCAELVAGLKRPIPNLSPVENARRARLISLFHERESDHHLAIRWAERALAAFSELGETGEIPHCYRLLFTAHVHMGRYAQARRYADLALAEPALSPRERLKVLGNLGALEYRTHRYKQALAHFGEAMKLLEDLHDDWSRAVVLYNRGNVHAALNQFAEADLDFESAHALFMAQDAMNHCAYVLQASGHFYLVLGQYYKAEHKLWEARRIYLGVGDHLGAALSDIELLKLDIALNRPERALERIPELVETISAKGRVLEMGQIYMEGVRAAQASEDLDLAEAYLEMAREIFESEKSPLQLARCELIRGLLTWRDGDEATARQAVNRARLAFRQEGAYEQELLCLIWLSQIEDGFLDRRRFQRFRMLLRKPLSPATRIQGLRVASDYWTGRGMRKRGIRALSEAVSILEESRASIASEDIREQFFADKTEIYERLIERLFQWRDPEVPKTIFRVLELSRSRHMTEILASREALPPVLNRDDPLILEAQHLDRRLAQLSRRAKALSDDPTVAVEEKAALSESVTETRRELTRVKREMGKLDRLSLFYPIALEPEQISSLLDEDQLLALYFMAGEKLYRIEMTRATLEIHGVDLPKGFMRDFNALLNILGHRIAKKAAEAERLAEALGDYLRPSRTSGIRHFTFVPHKSLQRFPLALLRDAEGRLLLEHATLSQCPNLPVFTSTGGAERGTPTKPVFFFSDDQADPRAPERHALRAKWPEAPEIARLGDRRTAELMSGADLIHFAGHGYFDPFNPDRSHLSLGGDRLSLAELARLDLSNRPFLNLAACQSGWTAIDAGNEARGFVISAFAAGTSRILGSLWEIDDEVTGAWMESFYEHIDKGLARAYRQACLDIREKTGDPALWAGFCLLGRR